jgi:multidrug resistance protein MdtO
MVRTFFAWLDSWVRKFADDLRPTPGRLASSLRIVLASILTLILLLVWQMPLAYLGLYIVFNVSRDSPAISLRTAILSMVAIALSVGLSIAVVVLSDNDPMARVLSVAAVTFLVGLLMHASSLLSPLASILGFVYCIVIALWENHLPADFLVKRSLLLLGTVAVPLGSSVLVEYVFANRRPAEQLQEQRVIRYQALETMFRRYAQGAGQAELSEAYLAVAQLAAAGQSGMQHLYSEIAERNLDPGELPIGARFRITMLAQLMDVSAAFGAQQAPTEDSEIHRRCAWIADRCHEAPTGFPDAAQPSPAIASPVSLLDRVEETLHFIMTMPALGDAAPDKEMIALPSKKVPVLSLRVLFAKEGVAFALKISLCATLCYLFYNAVAWPGISTSVTTVLIIGLSTTGAMKQKGAFRFLGAVIGGLILGLGSTTFLFPHMDTIASFVILIAVVSFIAAWFSGGRQFNYVGLQIAFSFYLVALEGFSAPTELAPARDRLIGILLAIGIMWFVFDQLWPVRTVAAMRQALASVLHSEATLLRLGAPPQPQLVLLQRADELRDQVGKIVAAIRTMNDAVQYEYGADRERQMHTSETILRAALTSVALFWNQLAVLHDERDRDFITQPGLVELRAKLAEQMDAMGEAVAQAADYRAVNAAQFASSAELQSPRYGEYVQNAVSRYQELQAVIATLTA